MKIFSIMPKKIKTIIKLNIPAGKATPAPPVGPALGQHGLAIMDFCKQYNEKTKNMGDDIVPVVITVYENRSFSFVTKTPPTSSLLLKAVKKEKGSGTPNKEKIGTITQKQLTEIAKIKMKDLNTDNLGAAMKIVTGTAKSMGIEIKS